MLAPRDDDEPERSWPPQSRRRLWRNRGLIAAFWTATLLAALLHACTLLT